MRLLALILSLLLPTAAAAQTVDGDAARDMLFNANRNFIALNSQSGLSDGQNAFVEAIFSQRREEVPQRYYGSVAISPSFFELIQSQGPQAAMLAGLFQVTGELHSVAAADRFALSLCEDARSAGQAPCVIAARILPRGWEPREISLSASATDAMSVYRRGSGPKALAASQATQAFAIQKGDGAAEAALTLCNRQAASGGVRDCQVVVAD